MFLMEEKAGEHSRSDSFTQPRQNLVRTLLMMPRLISGKCHLGPDQLSLYRYIKSFEQSGSKLCFCCQLSMKLAQNISYNGILELQHEHSITLVFPDHHGTCSDLF